VVLTVHEPRGQALAMASAETSARRKLPVVPIVGAAVVAAAAAVLVLRGVHLQPLMDKVVEVIRGIGPWAFFTACAFLPAVGVPLTVFTITAGEVFAPRMTMVGVIAAALLAIAVNLGLTYWLARKALRPLLSQIAGRYGYSIPRVTSANALSVALAVRLTPGPPFVMQSYILGLAEVPFRLYMTVSMLAILPWVIAAIVLGKGVFNGNFRMVVYGIGVLMVATIAIQAMRKRYVAKSV
jgi:uncharacterized membrane protein YdjX (TVP38/TMEM64 family)